MESVTPREEPRANGAGIGKRWLWDRRRLRPVVGMAEHAQTSAPLSVGIGSTGEQIATASKSSTMRTTGLVTMPWTFWIVVIWLAGSVLVLGHVMLGF